MKRPLLACTVLFSLGIIAAYLIKRDWLFLSLSAAFICISLLAQVRRKGGDIILLCLSFLIGAGFYRNSEILPQSHIANFQVPKNGPPYALKGFVNSLPEYQNNRTRFVFTIEELYFPRLKRNCCGNVLIVIRGKVGVDYGDELIIQGSIRKAFGYSVYGQKSYVDYLKSQGIYAIVQVANREGVVFLNRNKGFPLQRFAFRLKLKIEEVIYRRLSAVTASIVDAMVLGEKKNISPIIYKSMMRSGTVHILVVSGFNVGIVIFSFVLLLKSLRLKRRIRFYLIIPLAIIYCLITGGSNPVVRATLMAIVFICGEFLRRQPDIYNSCAFAALFILIFNPKQLFDVGFQLSFASVLAIVWLYPRIKAILRLENLKMRWLKFILEGCLVSFSAWLGTMGFIAYYFRMVSPVTVLANVFIVPLASLINLCGFCLVISEYVSGWLALPFASTTELLVRILVQFNNLLVSFPKAYFYLP
jgi:competence protein ComEC